MLKRFSFLALMIAVMITILAGAVQASIPAETSPADDLALNSNTSASDDGWGGGSSKSDLTDGLRTYDEWYHGLAFQKGWNQVTIDFGTPVTFTTVTAWWYCGGEGSTYQPQAYRIESWNGASWEEIFSTTNPSAYFKYPDATPADWWYSWVAPTENVFSPVTASKVRLWSYPKDGEVMAGYHVWLWEVEVYNIQVIPLDSTPPITTATISPSPNSSGWNSVNATVNLNANDNEGGSGVKEIQYTLTGALSGGATVSDSTAQLPITVEGITTLIYWATDNAGNIETHKSLEIKIDKTLPIIDVTASPNTIWPTNKKMVDVTINGSATDQLSGIASTSFIVTDEYKKVEPTISKFGSIIQLEAWREGNDQDGRQYTIKVIVVDNAGNQATGFATVICPHDQGQKKAQ